MIYYLGQEEGLPFKKTTVEEILEFCNSQYLLGVDTETTDLHPQIGELLLLQIGNEEHQFIIDVRTESLAPFKWTLENVPSIYHNAKFDLRWLYKEGIYPYLNVKDTFLTEQILMAGRTTYKSYASYAACCDKYLGVAISKTERNLFKKKIINERSITYGARDVQHLIPLFNEQLKLVRKEKLQDCLELEFLYVPVMAYIEDCGMLVDQEKWKEKIELDQMKLNRSLDRLDELYFKYAKGPQTSLFGNSGLNWGSPPQVLTFLHSQGLYPVDKEGKPTTSSKVIVMMVDKHEAIPAILDFRKHQKNCSTYGESFLELCNSFPDKRVRTSFRQILKTGRTGSGSSKDEGSSVTEANLQNIPGDDFTRSCFIPEEGRTYVVADYSQQEQNILANQSCNQALLDFFRSGSTDMHCFVVRKMHPELEHLSDSEIKKNHSDKRKFAKTCGFASNYGGNGRTVAYNLGLSLEEGDRIYQSYVDSLPGLFDYFGEKEKETNRQGYVLTNYVTKRRIYLDQIKELKKLNREIDWEDYRLQKSLESEKYFEYYKPLMSRQAKLRSTIRKAAMNSPIQSTGADMMKQAGILMFHWIVENDLLHKVLIPNIIHDEYIVEPIKELKDIVCSKLEESMINASVPFCEVVPMGLGIKESPKWEH